LKIKKRKANTYLGSLTSQTKRDFRDRKTKTKMKMKRNNKNMTNTSLRSLTSRTKREFRTAKRQIHIWEVSLRRRRETSGN